MDWYEVVVDNTHVMGTIRADMRDDYVAALFTAGAETVSLQVTDKPNFHKEKSKPNKSDFIM